MLAIASNGRTVFTERVDVVQIGRRPITFHINGIFEVRDGKVSAWREYFDTTDPARQRSRRGCFLRGGRHPRVDLTACQPNGSYGAGGRSEGAAGVSAFGIDDPDLRHTTVDHAKRHGSVAEVRAEERHNEVFEAMPYVLEDLVVGVVVRELRQLIEV